MYTNGIMVSNTIHRLLSFRPSLTSRAPATTSFHSHSHNHLSSHTGIVLFVVPRLFGWAGRNIVVVVVVVVVSSVVVVVVVVGTFR